MKKFHIFHLLVALVLQVYIHTVNYWAGDTSLFNLLFLCSVLLYQAAYPYYMKKKSGGNPYKIFTPVPVSVDGGWTLSYYVVDDHTMISKEELFRLRLLGEPVTLEDKHKKMMEEFN